MPRFWIATLTLLLSLNSQSQPFITTSSSSTRAFSPAQPELLVYSGFNFQFIPPYSNIVGMEVQIDVALNGQAEWQSIQLAKGTRLSGTGISGKPIQNGLNTFGSLTDLWGDTWNQADLNELMGVAVSVKKTSTQSSVQIKKLSLKIYYQSTAQAMILTRFSVEKTASDAVNILFGTSTEENIKELWVERSLDGRHFEPLIRVEPKGRRNAFTDYRVTDTRPALGRNYYRLKEVDTDGQSFYHEIRSVMMVKNGESFVVYASASELKVLLNNLKGRFILRVFSSDGRPLQQKECLSSGTLQEQLPLPGRTGIYHVILSGEGIQLNRTLAIR
jgi:hypothetical protein